eukprot:10501337-Alexandrium_andersonii.AAC.2
MAGLQSNRVPGTGQATKADPRAVNGDLARKPRVRPTLAQGKLLVPLPAVPRVEAPNATTRRASQEVALVRAKGHPELATATRG